MKGFSLRGKGIKKECVTLRYKQKIPGYMRNYLNNKSKRKYVEATSDILGKTLKVAPLYMTALGAFHVFSWAFFVSSGNPVDTSFLIQKEGITGGISRALALIVPHAMMSLIASVPCVAAIILIFLPLKCGMWVHEKARNKFKCRFLHFSCSCACGLLLFITFLYLIYNVICMALNSSFVKNFSFDKHFDYWVRPENFLIPIFLILIPSVVFFIKTIREYNYNDLLHKIPLVFIFTILFAPFFMFIPNYSDGYGTECILVEVEDSKVVNSSIRTNNGREVKEYMKLSEAIQSGGKDIAEILDKNKGNKTYVLASYVYSEDKDYLNIMVFSIRESYKDTEGKPRAKSDLLINENGEGKNGEGKSGVLVSIKKSSIAGRYLSNPLCFKGDS